MKTAKVPEIRKVLKSYSIPRPYSEKYAMYELVVWHGKNVGIGFGNGEVLHTDGAEALLSALLDAVPKMRKFEKEKAADERCEA